MSNGDTSARLQQVLLTRAWLFQAIAAAPTFLLLGLTAASNMYRTHVSVYDSVTDLSTALMAMGIIFVVLVQRQLPGAGKSLTWKFEVAKSGLATALWVWLMADSIWGPESHSGYGYPVDRTRRIVSSAFAVILLLVLFYPTVYFVHYYWPEETNSQAEDVEQGEREPLLQS